MEFLGKNYQVQASFFSLTVDDSFAEKKRAFSIKRTWWQLTNLS